MKTMQEAGTVTTREELVKTHAQERAEQRFGLNLNPKKLGIIVRIVKKGRARFVRSGTNGCNYFDVDFFDEPGCETRAIRVLMSPNNSYIATVVPLEPPDKATRDQLRKKRVQDFFRGSMEQKFRDAGFVRR